MLGHSIVNYSMTDLIWSKYGLFRYGISLSHYLNGPTAHTLVNKKNGPSQF